MIWLLASRNRPDRLPSQASILKFARNVIRSLLRARRTHVTYQMRKDTQGILQQHSSQTLSKVAKQDIKLQQDKLTIRFSNPTLPFWRIVFQTFISEVYSMEQLPVTP